MYSRYARDRGHDPGALAAGRSTEEILAAYPYLQPQDIQAALSYAAWRAQEIELPLESPT